MGTIANNDNLFGVAKWIVNPTAGKGTHTTIATALTSASSGDTIFITPGTYSENPTLKAGVNLTAFECDATFNGISNVIISGKCTMTTAGTVTISGIQLQTNSDFLLAVTGSVASIVNLNNCYLNCSNTTGISHTSSNSSSTIQCINCTGNIGTTGITLYVSTSTGNIGFIKTNITNTGNTVTASSISTGVANIQYCNFAFPLSTSSAGAVTIGYSLIANTAGNATSLTTAGTGSSTAQFTNFGSGTASCLSIGSGTIVEALHCEFSGGNTNQITGAGTLRYSGLVFTNGASTTINTTTQVGGVLQGGVSQAPSAGYIGEQIRSAIASGAPVNLTNGNSINLTSISLTAGIWDISVGAIMGNTGIASQIQWSLSTTTGSLGGVLGDSYFTDTNPSAASSTTVIIPPYRVTLTSTTIYYIVCNSAFSTGTANVYGRISATRVG